MGSLLCLAQLIFLCLLLFYSNFQATCSLSNSSNFPSSTNLCRHDQNLALLRFKKSFSIDSSASEDCQNPKTETWNEGTDCCSWDGVTCEMKTGHVIGLNLRCSMLHGVLHSNSTLFFLHHLQKLDLSDNDFNSSHVSSQFGKLLYLTHLSLSYSNFAGQVPSEISHLSGLLSLDLSYNSKLTLEPRSFNKLAQNLTQLRDLDFSWVNMSLVIPSSVMNLSSSLSFLRLSYCGLKGNFPGSMFHRSNLQEISLWANGNLTGSFSLFNGSSSLQKLVLSYTKISIYLENEFSTNLKSLEFLSLCGCNIIRSNLALLGNLTQLTWLDLSGNHLSGQIPSSLANLSQLKDLDLSHNNFTGQIPLSLAKLTELSSLDLSMNRLIGPIPSQFSTLSNLSSLVLYSNLLGGVIPSFLFALPFLDTLLLDDNLLSGHIRTFQYSSLSLINLSHNNLDGQIPSSIFEQENLLVLRLASNNKLTGEISSSVCSIS
ncbi:unnamed protein product [Dovyalis caffra]|uniref:Leucine-rich repeat-containing N-terminal plant-type domain-containing protein n=1 Tax=Dovyalis caffra TaxID=77055 RepID=A0AAV1SIG3_9ROSI|nr:unnamed protein product [Dovyalis caffra]